MKGTDEMTLFIDDKDCCGCTACESICPKNAIKMTVNKEGFLYPEINQEQCINCGLCIKTCQYKKDIENKTYSCMITKPKVFAVRHKSIEVRENSRSGGIFTAVSDWVLENGGVVFGAVLNEDMTVSHERATDSNERNRMRGSKYVQSDKKKSFTAVKKDLDDGKYVLYTGTSCEISGLQSYLRHTYPKLICMDIICHGVPSPQILQDYLSWQEKKHKAKVVNFDFRNKKKFGWSSAVETLYFKDVAGKEFNINSSVYSKLFYSDSAVRYSCFQCPYKSINHPADITIGDFWGIERVDSDFNADNSGASLVLVNSEKGFNIFNEIIDRLDYIESSIEDCLQTPLIKPCDIPKARPAFWYIYEHKSFGLLVYVFASSQKKINKALSSAFKVWFNFLAALYCRKNE